MYSVCMGILILCIMPILCGGILLERCSNSMFLFVFMKAWLHGILMMFTLYLPLALIVTFCRLPFLTLNIMWLIGMFVLAFLGGKTWCSFVKNKETNFSFFKNCTFLERVRNKNTWYILVIIVLVTIQIVAVTVLQTQNDDDAWYVTTGASAWYTGNVSDVDATGNFAPWKSMADYVLSPWPVFCATVASLMKIHPTIFMHSILPAVIVIFAYVTYCYIGVTMFKDRKDQVYVFVMIYALLNIMGNFSSRSVGVFLLQRPWQGKAVMTSILIPMLFATSSKFMEEERTRRDGIVCLLNMVALLLVSSMSVPFSGLVFGSYMLVDLLRSHSIQRLFVNMTMLIPDLVIGILYICIRMEWLV